MKPSFWCHVIVGMVAGYHHHGHQGYIFNFFCFQFRNHVFQGRPAFNAVNVDVAFVQAVETVLYYGVVSVGRMGSAMGHYQNGVSFAQFRELGGHGFREIFYIVRLFCTAAECRKSFS